jgi:Lrp/AsnC family transcriptional regulator, regulator of ectoine-degradation genes
MLKLDKVDLKILEALRQDGRMTKTRLAERVNLSPAACWERLNRLEKSKVIASYGARIDMSRLARFTTILVEVTLRSHKQSDFRRFEAAVIREPQIVACDATGGGVDYIMRIVARDIDAYQALIERLLEADIGIDRYTTYVVTKSIKDGDPAGASTQLIA